MITLENDFLKIAIKNKGAEIVSIFDKKLSVERLWQADTEIWAWHAPNLFPVVGGCFNNQITINGTSFEMQRHGFARHNDFVLVEQDLKSAKLSLSYSPETFKIYPYKFAFQVIYSLEESYLKVTYKVINYDEQSILFSVGAHPAFKVPFFDGESINDYYFDFELEEPLISHLLSPAGFFNGETENLSDTGKTLPITPDIFKKDALVFKDLKSRKVSIKSKKNHHHICIEYANFNYLGIWSKDPSKFICLEPWIGCADTEGKITELRDKEGILELHKGHVFEALFNIIIQ
ncbi:MAG: aldose 1-epimerase family protein [Flavobacterium sp.]|nr:aldose 1-epimerase family protein [Pedobacter sp.]